MLSWNEFVKQSLELHLFFARIMKEHSIFLETGFTPKDAMLAEQADMFKKQFDQLLVEVVSLSNGIINPSVILSGEIVTPYTLNAEMATQYFTGIPIAISTTKAEMGLAGGEMMPINPMLEQAVCLLNQRALPLIAGIIQFKSTILSQVLCCKIFSLNYPLLIDHILREAKLYFAVIQRLQNREEIDLENEMLEQEFFWNRIMAEHAKFIRGLLDPTENDLIQTANNFGNEFDILTAAAKEAMDHTMPIAKVTDESLKATKEIRDFKEQGTQGILECKVKSVILPLLGDHVLREANHYLRLLKKYKKVKC